MISGFDRRIVCFYVGGSQPLARLAEVLRFAGRFCELLQVQCGLGVDYPAAVGQVPREIWHGLLDRLRHELEHPDPNACFRGSLIDDKVFAIDVSEWGLRDLVTECRERKCKRILPPGKTA